jgi:hypothetical protein
MHMLFPCLGDIGEVFLEGAYQRWTGCGAVLPVPRMMCIYSVKCA